ncbi:alpha/beta hydrolase family protein [Corallococcus llansteffanensis]|nr:alpha/beta fold hydrolase [Corallococcus llansteffanensis]
MLLGEAPALVVGEGSTVAPGPRGTVLLLHGLGASKEVQRPEAQLLARHGYLAVIIDAVGHGERRYPDFDRRFAPDRAEQAFREVVSRSAAELPAVLGALAERGGSRPGAVGACGISMGGAILLEALGPELAVDAAVTVVAPPPRGHEALERLARFFPTPLLMQTAGADTLVPSQDARDFHHALLPRYASAPERLRYFEHPGEEHMFTEAGWGRVWEEVLGWFNRFMPVAGG